MKEKNNQTNKQKKWRKTFYLYLEISNLYFNNFGLALFSLVCFSVLCDNRTKNKFNKISEKKKKKDEKKNRKDFFKF